MNKFVLHLLDETLLTGKRKKYNDIGIAACNMEAGAELLTRDTHFRHIAGLLVNGTDPIYPTLH